jgi:hypothetical protein
VGAADESDVGYFYPPFIQMGRGYLEGPVPRAVVPPIRFSDFAFLFF